MWREFLSVLLIVSAILVLASEINIYNQISPLTNGFGLRYQVEILSLGLGLLFFIVFCVIWAIPETTIGRRFPETHRHNTEKEQINFKEENADEMLEKGYILNVETGKWEKPKE